MAHRLNPDWIATQMERMNHDGKLSIIVDYPPAKKALVTELAKRGVAYKITSLGAGVIRVDAGAGIDEVCPCCKRPLDK